MPVGERCFIRRTLQRRR